jgi:hypothetical protein
VPILVWIPHALPTYSGLVSTGTHTEYVTSQTLRASSIQQALTLTSPHPHLLERASSADMPDQAMVSNNRMDVQDEL